MGRVDYYDDPDAPAANSLVPGGSAVVADEAGRVLLQRRADSGRWALPGGTMEIGETLAQAVVREVREETGLAVEPTRIVGIYSDPKHVFAYDDGEVRQEFNVCLACRVVGGSLAAGEECLEVKFFEPAEIERLDLHPSIRLRIRHYLAGGTPYIG
jgi:ADP-ribose pyrophosphatase YjhB (NUDIX family)